MSSPTSPFIDHAYPVLAGEPTINDDQRADLHDAFYSKNPDELVQHLQSLDMPDKFKQSLLDAKQKSMPAVAPVDKIAAVMTQMTQMDPAALALAEAHPNVFKTLAAAANPPEKDSGSGAGASKGNSKGDSPKDGNKPAPPTADLPATPPGHALVQGADGALHHIPHANLDKARTIDPQLQILHVEP